MMREVYTYLGDCRDSPYLRASCAGLSVCQSEVRLETPFLSVSQVSSSVQCCGGAYLSLLQIRQLAR